VATSALTIHCDALHVNFLNKFITQYYDESDTDKKYVPHSMLNGKHPDYLKAYRNAIVFQNQFLSASRVLPVIGLHPKAMSATIQLGTDEPATVLTYIKRHPYFTSIEETNLSKQLGKYLFITTAEHFSQAKHFIIETLPQIWQKIDNTFLDALPSSVRCPRLTNSNLRDESTQHTVAMLSKAAPDDATIASKWSAPPRSNKLPTMVSVNYSDLDFPVLPKQPTRQKPATRAANGSASNSMNHAQTTGQHPETRTHPTDASSSTHSNATAASGGTIFTKDDCASLFTSLTESMVDKFEKQTEK
jgi:hypothetical protein